jgi:hypothetical protein
MLRSDGRLGEWSSKKKKEEGVKRGWFVLP